MAYVGLNVADTSERGRAFVRRHGWTWQQIADPARRRAKLLGVDYQPAVVLIDEEGRIAGRFDGEGEEADWQALLDRL